MAPRMSHRPFTATKSAMSLFSFPAEVAPPSEHVVAAVLQFADMREEHEDGCVTLRCTPSRLEREDMVLLLGEESQRARDVSVVWDDAESEIVRVIDLAPLRVGRETLEQVGLYASARQRTLRRGYALHRAAA